jgi:hypothetical protein
MFRLNRLCSAPTQLGAALAYIREEQLRRGPERRGGRAGAISATRVCLKSADFAYADFAYKEKAKALLPHPTRASSLCWNRAHP